MTARKRPLIASAYGPSYTPRIFCFPVYKYSRSQAKRTSSLSRLWRMTRGLLILKLVVGMLRKILGSRGKRRYDPEEEESCLLGGVPEDVKKGHFVVHAVDGGELRRFVVELSYLAHPGFLELLEKAEREFGFKQTGILAIPCGYADLQSMSGILYKCRFEFCFPGERSRCALP